MEKTFKADDLIELKLRADYVAVIFKALEELPFKISSKIISEIEVQANKQKAAHDGV